ncbi:MAG: phosphonate C-P lyase system protein PhnH [Magnetovibrio sp.]|nr:phosphonate C-P lyase system protein PhnH [Magnetovibrio sp.]
MNLNSPPDQPLAGFIEPVHDAQRVFRTILDAMSHPGKIISLEDLPESPYPLHPVSTAICLSLVDHETPVWGDAEIAVSGQAMTHLKFHCGCPVTADPKEARTILISQPQDLRSFDQFCIGTDERPDLSAMVIVQVDSLVSGSGVKLTGPGIRGTRKLKVEGVGDTFWQSVIDNNKLFPRGVDLILTTPTALVCLPRSTEVGV